MLEQGMMLQIVESKSHSETDSESIKAKT